jgi:hypothetical protein
LRRRDITGLSPFYVRQNRREKLAKNPTGYFDTGIAESLRRKRHVFRTNTFLNEGI